MFWYCSTAVASKSATATLFLRERGVQTVSSCTRRRVIQLVTMPNRFGLGVRTSSAAMSGSGQALEGFCILVIANIAADEAVRTPFAFFVTFKAQAVSGHPLLVAALICFLILHASVGLEQTSPPILASKPATPPAGSLPSCSAFLQVERVGPNSACPVISADEYNRVAVGILRQKG